MNESIIETKVVQYAKNLGWWGIKLRSPSCNGLPDRMFLKNGEIVFIEFKSSRGKLSEIQRNQIGKLRNYDFTVHIVDDLYYGFNLFK